MAMAEGGGSMAGDDRPPAMPGYASSYGHSMTTAGAAALAQAQGTLLARQQAWLAVRERRLEEARTVRAQQEVAVRVPVCQPFFTTPPRSSPDHE